MKIRNYMILSLLLIPLIGCDKSPNVSIEEQVITNAFINFIVALTYDEICNNTDPKSRYNFDEGEDKDKNVNLFGNQQLIVARIGGLMHLRSPEKSVEDGIKHLLSVQKKIEGHAEKSFNESCSSEEALRAQKTYILYTNAHPAVISSMIDKTIEEKGGTVTSMDDIENAGKHIQPE